MFNGKINGNAFAYKCKLCNSIEYRNTLRSTNMWCRKCKKNSFIRSAKDDKKED